MIVRPRLLDLFCGAGGMAEGYHRAGFDVFGVDHKPQPHYPFEFFKADALMFLRNMMDDCPEDNGGMSIKDFAVIHASPPCQAYSRCKRIGNSRPGHQELVPQTRALLHKAGLPFVIENVEGAPMDFPLVICGTALGLRVRRHRLFECSHLILGPGECRHRAGDVTVFGHEVELIGSRSVSYKDASGRTHYRRQRMSVDFGREAMGIDWMTRAELSQAIPPAYGEWIGKQLIRVVECNSSVSEVTSER